MRGRPIKLASVASDIGIAESLTELTGRLRVCRLCREAKHLYGGRVLSQKGCCYDCIGHLPVSPASRVQSTDRRIALLTAALTRLKSLK